MHDLGFREVQDLRALRVGQSAEATGRGRRRLDQLWISPELQLAYRSTGVHFDMWADHAAVTASFQLSQLAVCHTVWAKPQPFPWPAQWVCPVQVDYADDLTVSYASFWGQVEQHAVTWLKCQGTPVPKKMRGRASVVAPVEVQEFLSPVKKARKGDLQPTYLGTSLQHARYFRQLRRLQSLLRVVSKGVTSWTGRCNRDETWRAVRTAAGFPGGFATWWNSNGLLPALASVLPLCCPALDFLQRLFDGFQTFVRHYEQGLIQQRTQHISAC